MGSLKRFFRNVFSDNTQSMGGNDFERMPKLEVESHMTVSRYGNFSLTEAIRPSFDLRIVPEEGYRFDRYRDDQSGLSIPVLMISVTGEKLFDTFIELLDPLGDVVDTVLETSHYRSCDGHKDLYREQIDLPILKSHLYDFEDLLLNDGCCGIAVLNPSVPFEVQFDEHKMLIVYGEEIGSFEKILRKRGIKRNESMRFLTEAEHVHMTKEGYYLQFKNLQTRLGIDEECHATY